MILVGSHAAKLHKTNRREPTDVDLWVEAGSLLESYGKLDVSKMPKDLLDLVPTVSGVATANALFTIKCSHFQWDIHWEKTKLDILHMKALGCKLIPDLYERLKQHWCGVHGNKDYLSLKKPKDKFFNDFVKYKYDHDYLHGIVALPNKPVYEKCLKVGEDVLIDKTLFDKLTFEEKVRMFKEEVSVIAYERFLLHDKNIGTLQAYQLSLKKTLVRLTKGWASDFLILNLEHFIKPDYNMFENLENNLEEDIMSKVDLTVFQNIANKCGESLDYTIFSLCEGDDWDIKEGLRDHEYEHLEQEGGGEGGGEYCYGVFKLDGKIYKAAYSYYSHYGYERDGITSTLKEVKPVEKLVTVYE